MNLTELAAQIFDALEEFDRSVKPFGLYAVRDVLLQPKPSEVMRPFRSQIKTREDLKDVEEFQLKFADVQRWAKLDAPHFFFTVPKLGSTLLQMVRTSKIKVRQYGSKYHVDKGENFDERWDKLGMDKAIAELWSSGGDAQLRLLLFLGFDKAQRPFERELGELKPHQTRVLHGIEFFERAWDDSMGRGFKVKAALWAHRVQVEGV